jgi:hypothetical protein
MKRTVALGAAWTASAAAAVGLGFLAVSLVDASASPGPTIAETGTSSSAAASSSTSSPSTSSPSTPVAPAAPSAAGQYETPGGTVFADCATGAPVLAGVPAAGWWVDPTDDLGKMEFENDDDDIDVYVSCVDGTPRFALDDSASSSSASRASSSPSVTPSPSAGSGVDDSDGRIGGGHGSDDGPGDDSDGRDGGGHGSDD